MNTININENTILDLLINYFRLSINDISESISDSSDFINSLSNIIKHIKDEENWFKFCTAMDLFEDTQLAKKSFYEFDIDGPTKYNDIGEKYLRLYGILTAINLQMDSILVISYFSNHGNLKNLRNELNQSKIIQLRHSAASHNLDCEDNGVTKAYSISQIDLREGNLGLMDSKNNFSDNCLNTYIKEFDRIVSKELYNSNLRILKKIPKNSENKKKISTVLKHINNFYKNECYFSNEDDILYIVGL